VITDNGSGYVSKSFRAACLELGVRYVRTRLYTPKTNGKAERFVQTSLREWAYARPYECSEQRQHRVRPLPQEGAHCGSTPISRSTLVQRVRSPWIQAW
jgi:transposase InsO family protein